MRSLIVDDDETCRKFLVKALEKHGRCDLAFTGIEAIEAVKKAFQSGELYDAIFLDIMMPVMDGRRALTVIRELEVRAGLLQGWGSKIVMTTALGDYENVRSAFHGQCDGYLVKPLKISRLEALLRNLKLIPRAE
jgi:two-component system, chemotaxis family, chemotaxis protein CheY